MKKNELTFSDKFLIGFVIVLIVIALMAIGGWITMWAWNIVMPFLFKLPTITWIQAVAINILLSCLKGVITITHKK